jgi:cell wall-associated NlpC family hydrolase
MKKVLLIICFLFLVISSTFYIFHSFFVQSISAAKPVQCESIILNLPSISDMEYSNRPTVTAFPKDKSLKLPALIEIIGKKDTVSISKRYSNYKKIRRIAWLFPVAENFQLKSRWPGWRFPRVAFMFKDAVGQRRFPIIAYNATPRFFGDSLPYVAENDSVEEHMVITKKAINPLNLPNEEIRKKLVEISQKYLGTRYRWGGTSTKGFDCSGFTWYVYNEMGIQIPRSGHEMARYGKAIKLENSKPGDIIFFGKKNGSTYLTVHMAIIYSNENGHIKMIHSHRGGVSIDSDDSPTWKWYENSFLFVRRMI